MDKKAVLGLDVTKLVISSFLVIGILAVVSIIALTSLSDAGVARSDESATFDNETTTAMNATGYQISGTSDLLSCAATLTNVINATDGAAIASGNYTVENCLVNASTADGGFLNVNWKITGSYTFEINQAESIVGNVSTGTASFFGNTQTIFTILAVVIIISAIAIVVVIVNRFGTGERGGGL